MWCPTAVTLQSAVLTISSTSLWTVASLLSNTIVSSQASISISDLLVIKSGMFFLSFSLGMLNNDFLRRFFRQIRKNCAGVQEWFVHSKQFCRNLAELSKCGWAVRTFGSANGSPVRLPQEQKPQAMCDWSEATTDLANSSRATAMEQDEWKVGEKSLFNIPLCINN